MGHQRITTIENRTQVLDASAEILHDLLAELTDQQTKLTPETIDAFVARYPRHESAIRKMAPAVLAMNCFLQAQREPSGQHPTLRGRHLDQLGEYRIIRQIARGGMGIVFEAEQLSLSRRVALKILPAAALMDATQVARFRNEALAAAQLHHPNIVSVYDVGFDQGIHFYAMELVKGQDLARLLAQAFGKQTLAAEDIDESAREEFANHTLPLSIKARSRFTADIGLQVARALAYAHRQGIIHRDIKPSNLILDAAGKVWITDFGLARLCVEPGLTATGDVVGTLKYMSPEQAAGDVLRVDHRTDIFALGVTLFEVITGRPMRAASSAQELHGQTLAGQPPDFGAERKQIDRDLQTIIRRCTESDPEYRYQSAEDVADDLAAFLDQRPIRAKPATWTEQTLKWIRRNPAIAGTCAVSACLIAMLLGASTVWISKERQQRVIEQQLREQQAGQLEAELLRTRNERYTTSIKLAYRYWNAGDVAAMRDQLGLAMPANGESDLRGFEWYYLKGLLDSIPQPIGKHEGMAYYLEFIPGTRDFVTAGDDGLRVWKDGKEFKFIDQTPLGSQWIDFSQDGTQMLSASGKQVILWDTATWTAIRSFECELVALAAEFVPGQDNAVIVERPEATPEHADSLVRRIDLKTGTVVWRNYQFHLPEGMALSTKHNLVVIANSEGTVHVLNLETGLGLSSTNVGSGALSIACSPNEEWLAIGERQGNISIRPLTSELGEVVLSINAADSGITSLQFYGHEKLLASARDGTAVHYLVSPTRIEATLEKRYRYASPLWACRLNDDEFRFLASVDRNGAVSIRNFHQSDIQNSQVSWARDFPSMTAQQKLAYAAGSNSFDASTDQRLAISHDFDHTIFIWNLETNERIRQVTDSDIQKSLPGFPFDAAISHIRFIPDGQRIVISLSGRAIIAYDLDSEKCTEWLNSTFDYLSYSPPVFHPNKSWAATVRSMPGPNGLLILNTNNGRVSKELSSRSIHATWAHDGTYLIQDLNNGVFVLTELLSSEDKQQFVGNSSAQPAISPDGRTLAASDGAAIVLWNLPSGRELLRIPLSAPDPRSLRFSERGRRLTANYDRWQAYWQLDMSVEFPH